MDVFLIRHAEAIDETLELLAAVQALAADACVLLVGHEPGISGIGALLVGISDFPPLDKAEAARITDAQLRWRFAWNAEAPIVVR